MSLKDGYSGFKQDLTNIANAIREKKGIKRKMTLNEMEKLLEKDEGIISLFLDENSLDVDNEIDYLLNNSDKGYFLPEMDTEISFENYPYAKKLVNYAFYNSSTSNNPGLKGLKLGTIEVIGERACQNCYNLEYVIAPEVREIEDRAFYGTISTLEPKLSSFSAKKVKKIGALAFAGTTGRPKILNTLEIDCGEEIGTGGFEEVYFKELIAEKLVTLGQRAFSRNGQLEKISLPAIQIIPEESFSFCTKLSNVDIPKAKVIKKNAFTSCPSLKELYLPEVEEISKDSFDNSLEKLYIGNKFKICKLDTFWYSSTVVYVPSHLVNKYKKDIYWKNLTILPLSESD